MHLELICAEPAFNKTCLYRRVRAPITKTRLNNTRQRAKSKKSATPTSKGKFYENADSANINVRRTVVGPPLVQATVGLPLQGVTARDHTQVYTQGEMNH